MASKRTGKEAGSSSGGPPHKKSTVRNHDIKFKDTEQRNRLIEENPHEGSSTGSKLNCELSLFLFLFLLFLVLVFQSLMTMLHPSMGEPIKCLV